MTVKDVVQHGGYRILSGPEKAGNTEITGVYVCDLLSMAMARIQDGELWITVHTNINIVAVACLTNASCVVIPENIEVEEMTISKAVEKGVVIVQAPHTSYDICINYYRISSELGHD